MPSVLHAALDRRAATMVAVCGADLHRPDECRACANAAVAVHQSDAGATQRHRWGALRNRHAIPTRALGADHRYSLLESGKRHRHSCRPHLVADRFPTCIGHLQQRNRFRLATGGVERSPHRTSQHDLHRLGQRDDPFRRFDRRLVESDREWRYQLSGRWHQWRVRRCKCFPDRHLSRQQLFQRYRLCRRCGRAASEARVGAGQH